MTSHVDAFDRRPRCCGGCGQVVFADGMWCDSCWVIQEEYVVALVQPEPVASSPQFTTEQEIVLAACKLVNRDKSEHPAALERIAFLVHVLQNETLNNNEQKKET